MNAPVVVHRQAALQRPAPCAGLGDAASRRRDAHFRLDRAVCALLAVLAIILVAGCASVQELPVNEPLPEGAVVDPWERAGRMRPNSILLSFSGGGIRAAAFAHGVLLALHEQSTPEGELLDDVVLVSSVSGSSLTAAYFGLHGTGGLDRFREQVLIPGFESDLRLSLNPVNLLHMMNSGLNTSRDLAGALDRRLFRGATFADLHARTTVDIRIHATELTHRITFPFIPAAFATLCSDLSSYPLASAVAASMAVPVVFSPVVLQSYPGRCAAEPDNWADRVPARSSRTVSAIARAIESYQKPPVKYAKLVDGGLTDNFAVNDLMLMRLFMGTPYAPMTERDAVRVHRLLLIAVDASRRSRGEWAERREGPEGINLALAGIDAAIDSAGRFAADAFDHMVQDWQQSVIDFRCGLAPEEAQRLGAPPDWDCHDVAFSVAHLAVSDLEPSLRDRIAAIPTRLALDASQIDDAIEGGRAGTALLPQLKAYLAARASSR